MNYRQDRKDFAQSLEAYLPEDAQEITFKERMLSLLAYDNCFERSLTHAHFTGSAWVVDPRQGKTLLTHHAKLDRWLQLGGHADGDANMAHVATRELREESGVSDFELVEPTIFDIDIHTIPPKNEIATHDHYDVRYLFRGDADGELQRNHESKDLRWVAYEDVVKLIGENNSILRMLNKSLEMAF